MFMGKAAMQQKPEPTQNVLRDVPVRTLAAVRLTSQVREDHEHAAHPWFLLYEPSRDEFINETVAWLFGRQLDGSAHTWERVAIVPAPVSQ